MKPKGSHMWACPFLELVRFVKGSRRDVEGNQEETVLFEGPLF